jgi:hypothetical protein
MGGWSVLLAILAGLTPAIWACSSSGEDPAPDASAALASPEDPRIQALREALAEERARAEALAAEVARLRAQIDAGSAAPTTEASPGETPVEADQADAEARPAPGHGGAPPWFDGSDLLAGGLPGYRVERLEEAFDASEMESLRLRDLAMREGWYRTPRYRAALRDLRLELRREIGDEDYDLLLYASGRKNRVVISDVLGDSPGERAGLQHGDVVLSYDGQRVFKADDLREATLQGEAGDSTAMDILRDGEPMRLYLPRGPIGAKLMPSRQMPETR